jgi:hypothetical protein
MDKLDQYRDVIESILTHYHEVTISQCRQHPDSEVTDRLALDRQRDQYLWLQFGWEDRKLVQNIIVYICIKNNQVWVEQDWTDICIVDQLIAEGIASNDIVLGLQPPNKRMLAELAHVS